MSKEENDIFVNIFKLCSTGKLDYKHFYITDYYDRSMFTATLYGEIFLHTLSSFLSMVRIYLHIFGLFLCSIHKITLNVLYLSYHFKHYVYINRV